jgi:hypothetical protein
MQLVKKNRLSSSMAFCAWYSKGRQTNTHVELVYAEHVLLNGQVHSSLQAECKWWSDHKDITKYSLSSHVALLSEYDRPSCSPFMQRLPSCESGTSCDVPAVLQSIRLCNE